MYIVHKYDKWNFKPKKSSMFHFNQVTYGRMARVLGVKNSSVKNSAAVCKVGTKVDELEGDCGSFF